MKGLVLVNSRFYNPKQAFPNHTPVNWDECTPAHFTHTYSDEKIVIVFNIIPTEEVIKSLIHPFIIYTTDSPPKWIYDYARVNINYIPIQRIVDKIIQGIVLIPAEFELLVRSIRLVYYPIVQNIHRLYLIKVPDYFSAIERCIVLNSNRQAAYLLISVFKYYKPDRYVLIKYSEEKDWRKVIRND